MFAGNETPPQAIIDELVIDRIPGLEPARPQRPEGDVHEAPMLGRMQFVPMPAGRPSFGRGELRMPDSRYSLHIVCEVTDEEPPGSDQAACVIAFRRLQVQDAVL